MKSIYIYYLVFLLPIFLLLACNKEDKVIEVAEVGEFAIGVNNGAASITNFSPVKVIYKEYFHEIYKIDLDGDSVFDIELRSIYIGSLGGIAVFSSSIKSINDNFSLSSIEEIDTVYLCKQSSSSNNGIHVFYNSESGYNCSANKSIDEIEVLLHPRKFLQGENIDNNIVWSQEELDFSYYCNTKVFYNNVYNHYEILRVYWKNTEIKYVLIKEEVNGNINYGWIKLKVEDFNKISIYEYAI